MLAWWSVMPLCLAELLKSHPSAPAGQRAPHLTASLAAGTSEGWPGCPVCPGCPVPRLPCVPGCPVPGWAARSECSVHTLMFRFYIEERFLWGIGSYFCLSWQIPGLVCLTILRYTFWFLAHWNVGFNINPEQTEVNHCNRLFKLKCAPDYIQFPPESLRTTVVHLFLQFSFV